MDKRDHKQRYDAGLKPRDVLGAEWVDKSMAGLTTFNRSSPSCSTLLLE